MIIYGAALLEIPPIRQKDMSLFFTIKPHSYSAAFRAERIQRTGAMRLLFPCLEIYTRAPAAVKVALL